ncbi:universal stress protein [Amycolatopsis aidingensis]|uniref:universal stress protein n=1 Tax=Amycolatopsis aidingensis TaxID=2842453 RepID=UPI001C0C0300|nr:universal stress protein [Amycolatopsis aidingensis]
MSTQTADGTIVVGVDGSHAANRAVEWAARMAAERNLGLYLVHAFHPGGSYGGGLPAPLDVFEALEQEGRRILEESAAAAGSVASGLAVQTDLRREAPVPVLLELSGVARMIVLGASGSGGFAGMRLGSTAIAVSAHARCPVAVVRGRDGADGLPEEGPVVVGVDGSPISDRAIGVAFDEATERNAPLVAVHSWVDGDYDDVFSPERFNAVWESVDEIEQRSLAERLAGWQEKYPDVPVERVVVRDRPRHQLLEWSGRARLVVVGSRGRGGFRGMLLGSTSQALVQHAQCPVLVVRPTGEDKG